MKSQLILVLAAAVSATVCAGAARGATSVGINFVGGGADVTAAAGVISQGNWNNEAGNSGTAITGLSDSTGTVVSGLSLSYTSDYNVGSATSSTSGFDQLYSGHLESAYAAAATGNAGSNRVTAYLTNIPYTSYNLYVYTSNKGSGGTVYESTSGASNGGAPVGTNGMAYSDAAASTYIADDNYVEFTGLTGSSQYLVGSNATNSGGGGFNSGFAGLQIVSTTPAVPEPATLGVVAAGLGMLLLKRRKLAC